MTASEVVIICDGCGKDLTYTGNSVDYRLALVSQPMPSKGGGAASYRLIYPAIKSTKHFCGLRCLKNWAQS